MNRVRRRHRRQSHLTAIFYVSLLSYRIWRLKAFLSKSRKHKEKGEGNGGSDTLHIFEKCRDLHCRRRKQSLLLLSRPPSRDTCARHNDSGGGTLLNGCSVSGAREIVSKPQRTDATTTTAKMSPLPSLALRSGAEINVHFQLGTVVEYRDRLEDTDVLLN